MSINTMFRRILRRYGIAGSEPLFEPEELVGRRFGDKKQYFVENAVGDGGNSIVFRGRSIGTAETVAIKVLRTPQSVDKDELLKEYEAFQDLLHQNLLVPRDHGKCTVKNGAMVHYLVSEYFQGVDLDRILERRGRLPVSHSLRIIRAVCEGLRHAHDKGVIHRDIKPANIMIRRVDGNVRVIDFGTARPGQKGYEDRRNDWIGTVGYAPPEQQFDNCQPDPRLDVFAVGVVLYEMLTGQFAFPGEDPEEINEHVISIEPRPIRSLNPSVSIQVEELVEQMMRKDPRTRIRDCGTIIDAIDEITSVPLAK